MKKILSGWKGIVLLCLTLLAPGLLSSTPVAVAPQAGTFYVATDGNDTIGDGYLAYPL